MHKTKSGFTIIELVIVVVVIGILAAITIVAYNGIQARAQESAIYSDLQRFATAVVTFRTINGSYPASEDDLATLKIRATTSIYSVDDGYSNFAYCLRTSGVSEPQFAIGGLTRSLKPYYEYSETGLTPKPYTGPLTGSLYDICANVMGASPDFVALGYSGSWQPWAVGP